MELVIKQALHFRLLTYVTFFHLIHSPRIYHHLFDILLKSFLLEGLYDIDSVKYLDSQSMRRREAKVEMQWQAFDGYYFDNEVLIFVLISGSLDNNL